MQRKMQNQTLHWNHYNARNAWRMVLNAPALQPEMISESSRFAGLVTAIWAFAHNYWNNHVRAGRKKRFIRVEERQTTKTKRWTHHVHSRILYARHILPSLSLSLRVFFRSVCECKQKDSILMTQNNTFVWMFEFISKNVEWLCETDSNWHEMCFTVSRQIMLNEWNVELCVGLVWFEWSFAHACEFVFSEIHRIYDNKNALMPIFLLLLLLNLWVKQTKPYA